MQRLRDLVVVVPGIGGSVLSGADAVVWETEPAALAGLVFRPGAVDLRRFPELRPTGLVRTFSAFGSLLTIYGYDTLHRLLADNFDRVVTHTYQQGAPVPPNTDVLLFPYDFRRSVSDAAEHLARAVRAALGDETKRRVIVLAHSMGGLVARYWIGPLEGWKVCCALLTLGTPHRGAPKAIDWLVRGPGVGLLRHPGARSVLREWPSMYELLPQYEAVWDESAGREVELTELRPSKYADRFARMAAAGRRTHEDIATGWNDIPPYGRPDVVPYFGRGHATPNLVVRGSDGRLTITKTDPAWRGNEGWAGDGTVPVLSAIPRELGESRAVWRAVRDRHGPIANAAAIVEQLSSYSGAALPTRGGDTPERPWLGLDVDEIVPSGVESEIGVVVQPENLGAAEVHVTLTTVPASAQPVFEGPMRGGGRTWTATLPPLRPGRYRLDFEAQRVAGPESVFARADVVVLDPAAEADFDGASS
ncbi:esterase/lipase family protein [Lentzea sp. NPDC058450]|uniref:esterase/lipase family protein n=1 Tax=Lentzea sp. NPDC058450 TaxID=3346505 RepID=UPI003650B190